MVGKFDTARLAEEMSRDSAVAEFVKTVLVVEISAEWVSAPFVNA